MRYLKLFTVMFVVLFLSGCSCITGKSKIDAKVENVLFRDNISTVYFFPLNLDSHLEIVELDVGKEFSYVITDKGAYKCGNCLPIIETEKHYLFYLEGNKIYRMEKIHHK